MDEEVGAQLDERTVGLDEDSEATSFLRNYFDDDNFVARNGVEVNWFDITPSASHREGLRGLKIKGVPLMKEEAKLIGLDEGQRVTVYVPDGTEGGDLKQLKYMVGQPEKSIFGGKSEAFYSMVSVGALGRNPGKFDEESEQIKVLRRKVQGGGELVVLFGHGITGYEGQTEKVYGVPYVARDLMSDFLANIDTKNVAAVVDSTCTFPVGSVPELPRDFPPYFAPLDVVNATQRVPTVTVINEKVTKYSLV